MIQIAFVKGVLVKGVKDSDTKVNHQLYYCNHPWKQMAFTSMVIIAVVISRQCCYDL